MVDVGLLTSLAAWYLGNYYYNIYNKLAAKSSGGTEYAFTLAWLQLAVGSIYALFLWIAPEARPQPKVRPDPARNLALCRALRRCHNHVCRCPLPMS